ncbi:MAG: hypothetical protein JWO82_1564, partial [Akkermansiaceae bacterium]|nr:hypothetical protein [Akkermansiaceae bacterium]
GANPDIHLGTSIAVSGATLLTGAPDSDIGNGFQNGAAYLFQRTGSNWAQQTRLAGEVTGYGAAGVNFGTSVAIQGNLAVVGSPRANTSGPLNEGSVSVYERTGGTWSIRQGGLLRANDSEAGKLLGSSVALSNGTIVAGAYGYGSYRGAIYVFTPKPSGTGYDQVRLTRSAGAAGDNLGYSAAIDGDQIIAGAPFAPVTGAGAAGVAVIFTRASGVWTETTVLNAQRLVDLFTPVSDSSAGAHFGEAVAIKGDAVLVGAPHADLASPLRVDGGKAYYYGKSTSTGIWSPGQLIQPGAEGAAGAWFGYSVAMSADKLIVGSPGGSMYTSMWAVPVLGDRKGKVYVFKAGFLFWEQETILSASPASVAEDSFGISVSFEGSLVAVGAWQRNAGPGKAYLFARDTGGGWSQQQVFGPSTTVQGDFAATVALSGDTLLVGAPRAETNVGGSAGAAYVYRISDPATFVPVLSISRSGGNAVLSWPATPPWTLYRSATLAGGSWLPVTVTTDGSYTYSGTEARMFFRLQRP